MSTIIQPALFSIPSANNYPSRSAGLFPVGLYSIIYADPPWSYDDKANSGKRGACHKYPLMSDQEIYDLPVKTIAADDAILFLWATMPKLREAFEVIDSWGFTYKTNAFTWVKRYRNGRWFMGMGQWTRSNAELCLLATKGKPGRVGKGVSSVIDWPVMEHSRKPCEIRDRIVRLCGDLPRIELFSRESAPGWDYWGKDAGRFDR